MGQTLLQDKVAVLTNFNAINNNFTELYEMVQYVWGYEYDPAAKEISAYLGGLSTYTPGDTIPLSALPFHSAIRAAVQNADGTINYFLQDGDWSKKANGDASDLTGGDGDVMAVYPTVYEKHVVSSGKHQYLFSMFPLNGYTPHPAFVHGAETLDYICIGVYEAYRDTSDSNKLKSISGVTPTTSRTMAQFRTDAVANGGYLMNMYEFDLVWKMLAIKYGSFDFQAEISLGISEAAPTAYPCVDTGVANSLASADGGVEDTYDKSGGGTQTSEVPKSLLLENLWGHIYKFADGIKVVNVDSTMKSHAYICNDPDNYDSNEDTTDYENKGDMGLLNGYWINGLTNGTLLPSDVTGGSSATGFASYYYSRWNTSYVDLRNTITGINTGTKTITVAGDQTAKYTVGKTIYIHSSTGNDGAYTVVSSSYGAATEIIVTEAIPDATVDGVVTTGFGTDYRVVLVGGYATHGAICGCLVNAYNDLSYSYSLIGSRLCRKFEAA